MLVIPWYAAPAAAGVLLLAVGVQTIRLNAAQSAEREAASALSTCQDANESAASVIAELRKENEQWRTNYAARTEQAQLAGDRVEQLQAQLRDTVRAGERTRAEIYRSNPDAQAWSAAVVPDAIADRMRSPADRQAGSR